MIEYNKHKNKQNILLLILFMCFFTNGVWGQSNATINKLKSERNSLRKQISQSASLLKSTEKTVGQELDELQNLEAKITTQKRLIKKTNDSQIALRKEILILTSKIRELNTQILKCKNEYTKSLRYVREQHTIQQKMLFIFSANNFNQIIRRLRYIMEYANYQKSQAKEIQQKQTKLLKKQTELQEAKKEIAKLKESYIVEQKQLEISRKEQKQLIQKLNKKKTVIKKQISIQQKKARALNSEIDRKIKLEIQRAEAIRKERERKARIDLKKNHSNEKLKKKSQHHKEKTTYSKRNRKEREEIKRLSGSFVSNKGKMPYPISGEYIILQHFGTYSVNGLQFIKLDNKGLIIKGKQGAKARSIFNGKVTAIFPLNGLLNIIIKHGEYRTIYCNLKTVDIKMGDNVKIGQTLGYIYVDPVRGNKAILHFQIRKGTKLINPESWIR